MRLLFVALLVLLATAPAHAQDDGAVVARHGDAQLLVKDEEGDETGLCLDLRVGESDVSGSCGNPLRRPSTMLVSTTTRTRSLTGGAVPAGGTVEVELEFARGERIRARTVTGEAYSGRLAGKLAFFLIDTTTVQRPPDEDGDQDEPVLIRRFDANGKLIGASGGGFSDHVIAGPQALTASRGLKISAVATRVFAPSVLQLDRTETSVCLRVRRDDHGGSSGPCSTPGPALPTLEVVPQRECARGTLVYGFVSPRIARVEVVLGNGRRVSARMFDVSELGTSARAAVLVVPVGMAVRSARALDAAGRVAQTQDLHAAPAHRRCAKGAGSFVAFGYSTTMSGDLAQGGQVAAGAAPGPQLLARDEGDHLCLGIGGFGEGESECVIPPPETEFAQMIERTTPQYTALGGLVPAGVHSVRVTFDGRTVVNAAIGDGGAYDGKYRGHVRFYLAHSGPGRRITNVETFDAAGTLLSALPGPGAQGGKRQTIARGRGFSVYASRYDFRFKFPGTELERSRGTCFGLAPAGHTPRPEDCTPVSHPITTGAVWCSPRRGAMMGQMTAGSRGAVFELAGGGTIRSRTIRVPRRLGGGRLWLLEIPPRARVKRLRYLGRLPSHPFGPAMARVRDFPLPPPRRQCGYALDLIF